MFLSVLWSRMARRGSTDASNSIAPVTPLPALEMIAKVPTIKAHNIWLTSGNETRRKAAIEFVTKGLQTGALKPVIDRTFTFDEMADVHRYLEQSGQFGKIVVTV